MGLELALWLDIIHCQVNIPEAIYFPTSKPVLVIALTTLHQGVHLCHFELTCFDKSA
jgi:hypothetical protein